MIKANELRAGNWVYLNNEVTQVTAIPQWVNFGLGGSPFEPIPLTPEILGKCGFEGANDSFWDERSGLLLIRERGIFTFTYNVFPKKARLPYLHQLQNLYFALTGTELEVKL